MKLLSLLLLFILITPINYDIHVEGNSSYQNACRYNVGGYIYVHIEGGPYQRGYQHGYLLYAEIIDMMYRWSNIIHNCPVIMKYLPIDVNSSKYENLSYAWWNSCKKNAMKIFWNAYPEEYKMEIKGIADGVNARGVKFYGKDITYEDILTLNEMYELMSILTNPQKGLHVVDDIYHALSSIFPVLKGKENEFYFTFTPSHHCNGFAAVGNATKDGEPVISDSVWCGGWWYTYYIAQRWNVLLDIQPSNGHRIIIATSPGYIWSDEDYWQNDAGLAMIETTFIQGPWRFRGIPLSIRARMAMQYGNSIDDVVNYMLNGNTGVMDSQWLIADSKAKEIALLEFGLYQYAVERTKNGFLWSANNPFNFNVRREILSYESLKAPIFRLAHFLLNATGYQYYTYFYTPSDRDKKFRELGEKYYGSIDVDTVKKIMSTPPISDFTTDIKITSGKLMEQNSLWAFFGNPNYVWNTTGLEKLKGVRSVAPAGWSKIVAVPGRREVNYVRGNTGHGMEAMPIWEYKFGSRNYDYAMLDGDGKLVYAVINNTVHAFDHNGSEIWSIEIDDSISSIKSTGSGVVILGKNESYMIENGSVKWEENRANDAFIYRNKIYFARDDGVYEGEMKIVNVSADKIYVNGKIYLVNGNNIECYDNGKTKWSFTTNMPFTGIEYEDDKIYASSLNGNVYCFSKSGRLEWHFSAGWSVVNPPVIRDKIYFASLDGNVYALNKNGSVAWIFSTNGSIYGGIAVYGEYVFAGSDDGRLYAINRSNGNVVWSYAPFYEIEGIYNYITTPIRSNVVASNGRVFFSSGGSIFGMDAGTYEMPASMNKASQENWLVSILIILAAAFIIAGYAYYRKRMSHSN